MLPLVVVLAVGLTGWYVVGNEVMRRQAHRLALWGKRVLDPTGAKLSIAWLTTNSFRLHFESGRAPLRSGTLTGLTEAWEVPFLWLWNRVRGRRDMVLVQLELPRPPLFGLELYRPGSLLAGDAQRLAIELGWHEEPCQEFRLAAGSGAAPRLAAELLAVLSGVRGHLLRVAVRRQPPTLTLAVNVPIRGRPEPAEFNLLLRRLAEVTVGPAGPAGRSE